MGQLRNIVDISKIDITDLEYVGKKAYELSELNHLGIPIPQGFVITTYFFEKFLKTTKIEKDIDEVKKISHPSLKDSIGKLYEPIGKKLMRTHIPHALATELHRFYRKLAGEFKEASVNIFSSSLTNKITIFKNIKGDANIVLKIKTIWFSNLDNPVAIVVQENIKPEIKGQIFTDSPTTDKKLTKEQMEKLIDYCKIIQKHFYFPQVVDYVIGKNKIYITQIKPFTGAMEYKPTKTKPSALRLRKTLIKGLPVNPGIVAGPVKIFRKNHDFKIKNGDIIVTSELNSSTYMAIKNARALIIDSVLPKTIDKILYRKSVKIPTVEGAQNASILLQNGNVVTVNGITGEIYAGSLM